MANVWQTSSPHLWAWEGGGAWGGGVQRQQRLHLETKGSDDA